MTLEPIFQSAPAFKIIGVERYTDKGLPSIQEADDEFFRRRDEVPNATTPKVIYGFEDYSRDLVMTPGEFPKYYYIAAMSVKELSEIPEGMVGLEVPASNYAVFDFQGPISDLAQLFRYIYDEWFPKSGYKLDPNNFADFERFPGPVTDMQNAHIEIHVPIVPA